MATGTVVARGYLATVDGVCGRVRATFARSVFVTVDGGSARVLHAAGGDLAPTSLCLASWPVADATISAGDPVVGRAGHLKVGALVLDARGARVWRPAPPACAHARVADPFPAHRGALRAAERRTGGLLCALELALAGAYAADVADRVAALVGLGPGLTPSGDDALVGLLAVLHRLAPGDARAGLLRRAVEAQLHRTGDVSAHYLGLAAAGHAGERLVALCDALSAGTRSGVEAAAAAVVATGATSGADALLGVVSGLRLVAASPATAVAA